MDNQKGHYNIFGEALHRFVDSQKGYTIFLATPSAPRGGPTQEGHSDILGSSISNELGYHNYCTATLDPYLINYPLYFSHLLCVRMSVVGSFVCFVCLCRLVFPSVPYTSLSAIGFTFGKFPVTDRDSCLTCVSQYMSN